MAKIGDVDIKTDYAHFKLRVCGIIKQGDYILTLTAKNHNGYCFPGGHVELGETTKEAVLREVKEELKIDAKVDKLVCINENFYNLHNGKLAHEIGYYYLMTPLTLLSDKDFWITEDDGGVIKHHLFHWMKIDNAKDENLMPPFIYNVLKTNTDDPKVIVTDQR